MDKILFGFLIILFLFIIFLALNALRDKLSRRRLSPRRALVSEEKQREYALSLSEMIKCKTVSQKDSFQAEEFERLRRVMEELFPLVHSQCEKMIFSDDCWVFRLNGKNKSRNILLMSHHDVVAAEGEWLHPPFCGEIFDGALWGRGTVDTKTSLFGEFQALEELLREGFVPECNIFIASSHNEELGGDGIPLTLEYFKKEGISFEAVLDEGGAIIAPPLPFVKSNCAMIAVHENGRISLTCKAKAAEKARGLAPDSATPVSRMSAFITEVSTKNIFIRRLYPQTKAMLSHISPYAPFFMTMIFSNLSVFGGIIKSVMPKLNAQAVAMVGTTCSFTDISMNREEKLCTAKAFLRPVDEDDFRKELERIKKIAEKYDISIEEAEDNKCFRPADTEGHAFNYIKRCISEIFPDVIPAPYILPAGTDARHLCEICPCVIRFAPIELDNKQFASVHNNNENLGLESIGSCVAFYKHYIKNYK